jgi:site-specific recombinase XerD
VPRQLPHICILNDGRRVPFSIKSRPGDLFYFICFRSPDGRRLERSTKETSRKRAEDAAGTLIKEEYDPKAVVSSVTWDEAIAALEGRMRENNNKTRTIEDYSDTLRLLIRLFPATRGPCNITVALAKEFKSLYQRKYTRQKAKAAKVWKGRGRKPKPPPKPATYSRKARTVASRLNKLRVIWSKWFIEELSYLTANPWEEVATPKLDKLTPRYLTAEEVVFFGWLTERWDGWRLPVLFFTVKGFLGNRIGELCGLRTDQLREGRVVFTADATKGRKERKAILPVEVYAELQAQAGPVWVWERFPDQLRERFKAQERMTRNIKPDFRPKRLKWWLQDELADFNAAHPDRQRIKAHDFRRRAMTEAWKLGIPLEKAAVAFGCNPNTMRTHYIAMDETAVADEVLNAIAEKVRLAERTDASPDVPQAG